MATDEPTIPKISAPIVKTVNPTRSCFTYEVVYSFPDTHATIIPKSKWKSNRKGGWNMNPSPSRSSATCTKESLDGGNHQVPVLQLDLILTAAVQIGGGGT